MIATAMIEWSLWDEIDITANILINFLTIGFIVYSIHEGLNELKNTTNNNTRYLRIYGLIFQILILIGGTLVLITLDSYLSWRVIPPTLFFVSYLVLTLIDLRKLKQTY